ncbi:hypothetical protein WS87_08470 [Burkholderia sp. MSMB0856]|uniref:hypothetical protein n=1 Tax=Burkholderia sp. MSMB0856 TaxID=1637869 RepID=UPI00075D92CF|nr:hypothetical protein [Burkholderia sp. MSMB0856]AOJ86702.1 hypothetical protein WS87_08470 [Burkholderia sp. MSMB0856]KVH38043.1 hypothetical protein WS87_00080 [Burkholderia sp. MSMB0856]
MIVFLVLPNLIDMAEYRAAHGGSGSTRPTSIPATGKGRRATLLKFRAPLSPRTDSSDPDGPNGQLVITISSGDLYFNRAGDLEGNDALTRYCLAEVLARLIRSDPLLGF